jgi:hypothetical protein
VLAFVFCFPKIKIIELEVLFILSLPSLSYKERGRG